MNWNQIFELVIQALIIPLIAYGLALLRGYIVRKVKISQVESILLQATMAVEIAVKETSQVYVDELKEQNIFDYDAQAQALKLAKNRALQILSPAGQELLERAVGDVNSYIEALIEATVNDRKKGDQ
jgi:N-methylhydantoinase B/oxoprolinase/acetone carboxylase alpha subunit